jgi:hypothetical protein
MMQFPLNILKLKEGVLNAKIFENSFLGIPKTLFFNIEIPLQPIDLTEITEDLIDRNFKTIISLGNIKFVIKSLKSLENKTFNFPINPEIGFIDGSVYLFDVHNIVDVKSITFGEFENQKIPFKTTLRIDLELEGTGFASTKYVDFETELSLGELSIPSYILAPNEENFVKSKALVSQFIAIGSFDKPFVGEWGITFKMKN